ncbi:glycosyltransferase [Agromyces bracchium]|uniref:Glycosyltransferase n=1 Tax=Agromyces bracchium TaxID=88376 RepID=A0A6I3M8K4_9MICO|nr:glycosyltransferase [Agromyces bracchium]MTH66913.1 glycosyltransferase [Agromyces bracchium]
MRIVQIVPFIGPGSGVAGVAWNLDREFRALGAEVENFTLASATRGLRQVRVRGWRTARIAQAQRMIWFSVIGTRRAKAFLAERPDAVSICHNNAMVGDVYVNHGVLLAAMRARGNSTLRFLRDPTHIFTHVRDVIRYRSDIHRRVVVLSDAEIDVLKRTYGRVRPPITVIPNGVDLERFRPPTDVERREARERFQLDDEHRVAVFVGHEFDRKGLPIVLEAMASAPTVLLMVVGGNARLLERAKADAERLGVADRVLFVGQRGEVRPFLSAADMFVLPSHYESSGLVFLEALACGLPVVATSVGVAAELVRDGENGFLVGHDAAEIARRLEQLAGEDLAPWRERARASVAGWTWADVARRYLELAAQVAAERDR